LKCSLFMWAEVEICLDREIILTGILGCE